MRGQSGGPPYPFILNLLKDGRIGWAGGRAKPPTIRPIAAFNYPLPWPYSGGRVEYKLPEAAMNAKTIIIGLVILAVVITVIINVV